MRVSLPDQPGALSAVAAAIGRCGADISSLAVIERAGDIATDDICVEGAADPARVRAELEAVPGVIVERLTPLAELHDGDAAVALACTIAETGGGAVSTLVDGLAGALWATWAVALVRGVTGLEALAISSGAPDVTDVATPWLPLDAPRRLAAAEWMPQTWRVAVAAGALELAAAPLATPHAAVLLGRVDGPRFRRPELRQLGWLARIAVSAEVGAARQLRAVGVR